MNTDSNQNAREDSLVLLLAGGSAKRFGSDKRREIIDSEKMLIEKTISQYLNIGIEVLVCLSSRGGDDSLEEHLREQSVECLRCRRANEGIGGTLAESAAAIGDVSKLVIALADMPALLPRTILTLLEHADSEHIVYPVYGARRGHPVVFGGRFLPLIKLLSGDRGASKLLEQNAAQCVAVEVNDPGVLLDVDTPEDLRKLRGLLQARSS
ncbi:nucleotidyltransferase family protein [Congregibacter brevis]|uniref:Nucleotidyltransferase family protein n=1 Tax=Congregibacter brevis TaxID=3081201 RepID=A0ABZ0IB01_9GAMM|nr:nucleotidyltransferase family protein [Congregibacter sp. IMCC45268]